MLCLSPLQPNVTNRKIIFRHPIYLPQELNDYQTGQSDALPK